MAQYFNNFADKTTDSEPSGWTKRWSSSNVSYKIQENAIDKEMKAIVTSGTYNKIITLDAVDSDSDRANSELLFKFKVSSVANDVNVLGVLKGSGTTGGRYGYVVKIDSGDVFSIYKYVNGVETSLDSDNNFGTFNSNTWYWIRFRVNGSSIKARFWKDGDAEPGTWGLEATDSSVNQTNKWAGVGVITGTTIFDTVEICTNGDTCLGGVAPDVQSDNASNVGVTTVRANGTVNTVNDTSCTRYIEYGTTTGYGTAVNCGSGSTGAFYADITGLSPNTAYHYRAYATNSFGTSTKGADKTFTTGSVYKAINLDPSLDEQINPLIQNTFTWAKDASAVQTHYEIEYRIKPEE